MFQFNLRPNTPNLLLIGIIVVSYLAPEHGYLKLFLWPLFWFFLAEGPTVWLDGIRRNVDDALRRGNVDTGRSALKHLNWFLSFAHAASYVIGAAMLLLALRQILESLQT